MSLAVRARSAAQTLLALLFAFAVAGIIIWATGGKPFPAFDDLFRGAFGNTNNLLRTLSKATPLIFTGLAVAVALRAGLFNIGAEGQLLVGGLAAAWVGYAVKGLPAFIHLPLAIIAAAVAGAVWAVVPGILKAWRGTHEVIVTIMMNYIAIFLTHYLVHGIFKDKTSDATRTPEILATARLWALEKGNTNFSAGFFLAILAAILIAFLIKRTALGFEIRAVGHGADAARASGISVGKTIVTAMLISGALAGLAGAVEVLGVHHHYYDQFSPGYGFDSIAVALLGGLTSSGVTMSAILFGGLNSGAIQMELGDQQTPRQIAGIVQAIVIIAVGVKYLRHRGGK